MRVKNEGRLYHRPSILHYFASILFNKDVSELTKEDLERAKTQFITIVSKYWYDKRFKKHQIASILKDYEAIFKKTVQEVSSCPHKLSGLLEDYESQVSRGRRIY